MDNKAIGVKISRLRGKLGLTTTELAKRVGISQAQVSRLENGKQGFRSHTLTKFARALGVKPLYFFMEELAGEAGVREAEPPIYGLAVGGDLLEALKAPDFVRVAEQAADAFFHNKDAFKAVELVVKTVLEK